MHTYLRTPSGWFTWNLLRQAAQLCAPSVIGYCLMSNHVHLVVIPRNAAAIAKALDKIAENCQKNPN